MRTARVTWLTHPPHGRARVAVGAKAFTELPLSFAGESAGTRSTTPGELLAAAHCGAVAVLLARVLADQGTPARELVLSTAYTFEDPWYALDRIEFDIEARVDDLDQRGLERAVDEALELCAKSIGLGERVTPSLTVKRL